MISRPCPLYLALLPGALLALAIPALAASPTPDADAPSIATPADIAKVLRLANAPSGLDQRSLPADEDATLLQAVHSDPGELPRLRIHHEGKDYDLPLRHTHVDAQVSGFAASVEVTQRYDNPFAFPIEAIYVFPLPENSAVDDMHIVIGRRTIRADIHKRKEARRIYEEAKQQGQTAALLEQERPNIFTQSVANIAPGESIEVVIHYVQTLSYDAGTYEFTFPMVVGPRFIPGERLADRSGEGMVDDTDRVPDASRITPPIVGRGLRTGHDISLELRLDSALPVLDFDTPTHKVDAAEHDGRLHLRLAEADSLPNRDFVLRYRVADDDPQVALMAHKTGRSGTFALQLVPPALDVEALVGRREMIFVVDSSGSMSGVPLGLAKEAVRSALTRLRPVDTFNVITFAGRTAKAFSHPVPADQGRITQALGFLDGTHAGGGTFLDRAVADALSPAVEAGRHRYVLFLTDGYVGNEREIFGQAEGLVAAMRARGQRARVLTLGTGSSVNRHLLDGLATAGDGTSVYVTAREEPTRAVDTFFRLVDHPVLTDITLDWGGLKVSDVEPQRMPDLFASQPLVVHGRYKGAGKATVTLRAKANGKPVELRTQVVLPEREEANEALGSLWARARVATFERDLWHGPDEAAVRAITDLGLEFRLVTAFTSFVAVDTSRTVKGQAKTIVQPVEAPEAVNPAMAAPGQMVVGKAKTHSGGGYGFGGVAVGGKLSRLGARGTGSGGGGVGLGRVAPRRVRAEAMLKTSDAPRPAVVVPMKKAEVQGHMDAHVVRRVFRSKHAAIRAAYVKRLAAVPGLSGKLVIEWVIGADGRVVSAKLASDTIGDKALAEAILKIVRTMRFPASEQGAPVTVKMPLVLNPET